MPAISMGCCSILYGLYRILNMGETPSPAAARHGPIELGWAEGRAVSLLRLAKVASAHPPRLSTAADLNNPVFQE